MDSTLTLAQADAARLTADPARVPNALEQLTGLLADDLGAVETIIHERMMSPVGMIPDLAAYLVDAGGKRIRPMVTLAAARALGPANRAAQALAAAVEFIHTATLLHDDVVDGSDLRRGKQAANLVWGNSASVLVGDFLFARSFNLMVEAGDLRMLDVLANAASVIAEGEVMQLASARDRSITRARYYDIIDAKTAALFAAAGRVGAQAAGASGPVELAFETYGRELGLAFQLVDDALDYGGATQTMGKRAGDDFRERKLTLPVILARDVASAQDLAFWDRVFGAAEQAEGDFEQAVALLHRTGAIEGTLRAAREHAARAQAALELVPPGPVREALSALPDFVVARAH